MKIAILIGAALMGTAAVAAAPADAQRWGGRHDRWDGPSHHRQDWRGNRGWRGDRGDRWRGQGRGYGWNGGGGRDRGRLVCRTYRSYYGPERRCYRVNRW